jgi:predicted small metal-binding protein
MSPREEQNPRMTDDELRTSCACGWETSGPVDAVVAATIEHGARVHNMSATREEVLAMARAARPAEEERHAEGA